MILRLIVSPAVLLCLAGHCGTACGDDFEESLAFLRDVLERSKPVGVQTRGKPSPVRLFGVSLDRRKMKGLLDSWESLTQEREWSDSTGKHSVKAQYVGHDDNGVKLQRKGGATVVVPLDRLGEQEQNRISSIVKIKASIVESVRPALEATRKAMADQRREVREQEVEDRRISEIVTDIDTNVAKQNLRWLLVRLSGPPLETSREFTHPSGLRNTITRPVYAGPIANNSEGSDNGYSLRNLKGEFYGHAPVQTRTPDTRYHDSVGCRLYYRASALLHLIAIDYAIGVYRNRGFHGLNESEQDMALYGLAITASLPLYDRRTGNEVANGLQIGLRIPSFNDEETRLFSFNCKWKQYCDDRRKDYDSNVEFLRLPAVKEALTRVEELLGERQNGERTETGRASGGREGQGTARPREQ